MSAGDLFTPEVRHYLAAGQSYQAILHAANEVDVEYVRKHLGIHARRDWVHRRESAIYANMLEGMTQLEDWMLESLELSYRVTRLFYCDCVIRHVICWTVVHFGELGPFEMVGHIRRATLLPDMYRPYAYAAGVPSGMSEGVAESLLYGDDRPWELPKLCVQEALDLWVDNDSPYMAAGTHQEFIALLSGQLMRGFKRTCGAAKRRWVERWVERNFPPIDEANWSAAASPRELCAFERKWQVQRLQTLLIRAAEGRIQPDPLRYRDYRKTDYV